MFMFFYFNHLHARMAAWLSVLLACQYFLKPVISQSFSKIALPVRLSCNTKRPPQGGPGHHFLGLPASERFSRTLPLLLRSRGCVPPPGLGTTTSGLSGLLSAMFRPQRMAKVPSTVIRLACLLCNADRTTNCAASSLSSYRHRPSNQSYGSGHADRKAGH